MKVALVYDRVNKWGGAERVLLDLHEMFPDAPLYTSVYDSRKAKWARVFDVRTSFLQKFPFASSKHEMYPFLMPFAFESFSFDEYDLVISVTSEAAKGIVTKPHTKHICICLTPTRYLWSGYEEYFRNPILRVVAWPIVWYLRKWDKIAAERPDVFVAISKEVQGRIAKYYGRKSEVIYPAVSLGDEKSEISQEIDKNVRNERYFLVVSRLVAYKRVDLAIHASNTLRLPLKVIGTGSEEKKLRSMAGSTVEFLKNLTDDALVEYYRRCSALIFPGHEDLGLSIIEAQKFGRPVIAYKAGGALETVVEGKTGFFFTPQTIDALVEALKTFEEAHKDLAIVSFEARYKTSCQKQAARFTKKAFKKNISLLVKKVLQ